MKKILAGLMCLMMALSFSGLCLADDSDASVLSYDELMNWVNSCLDKASTQTLLNAPIDEEDLTEDGYAFVYEDATFYFDKPQTEDASLLAMSYTNVEQPALRGIQPDMDLKDLLAAFYNENPDLVGDEDFAALYCVDALPASASWAWLQRNGQQAAVVQYAVHEQPASGDADGYTDCGLLITLAENAVVSIKVYGLSSYIDENQARGNLAAVKEVQSANSYHMFPTSRVGTDLDGFERDDLFFSGMDFLSATPEKAEALLGKALDDVWMEDGAGYLRTLYFPNAYLTFAYNADKTPSHLDFLTIDGPNLEGPRGVCIGDSLSSVIMRFRHNDGPFDGVREIFYGDGSTAPYGTAEYGDNASATLRYVLEVEDGKHITLQMVFTLNALSEILIYCW